METSTNILKITFFSGKVQEFYEGSFINHNELWEWIKEPLAEDKSNNEFMAKHIVSGVTQFIKSDIKTFLETDYFRKGETERSKEFHNR